MTSSTTTPPLKSHQPDGDDFSTAATATEGTPLIQSDTDTLRDGTASPAESTGSDEDPVIGWKRAVCIILSMWALIFLQASNMSGMTMTQSTIAADLDSYAQAMWFTSSYLITTASMAPLVGRLAMIFSPGIMILVAALFFALGALICSVAKVFPVFIAGRVISGVGGAGVLTLSMILVLQLTSKRRRGLFIGMVNAGFTIGLSSGAVVFGALLPSLGWRALFLAQAPLSLLAGIGVYFSLPHFSVRGHDKTNTALSKLAKIDYLGAVTLTTTIVLFLYGLSSPKILILPIILSFVSLGIFLATEYLYTTDPIIPISVLQSRGVLLSCVGQLGFMAARWTVLFYAPVFVLAVRGYSPAVAGSVLIPTNAGFGLGGVIVGWLHVKRTGSFWLASLVSLVFFILTIFGLSFLSTAAVEPWLYVTTIFLNGFATGACLNYTLAHMLHLAAPETHFIATSLLATFRGFAGSFGTAIGGGAFGRTLRDVLTEGFTKLDGGVLGEGRAVLITRLIGSPALVFGGGLSDAERAVAVGGYEAALRMLYRGAAAVCLLVLVVQAGTGWSAPVNQEEEDEIEEEIAEHDGRMEA